tara:strand:- start:1218 stop:1607 length:390 start_codon:yes stop_codon:yes gene_type:complete
MYGMNYGNVTTLTFAQLQDAFVNGTVSQEVFDAEVDRRGTQPSGIGWSNVANILSVLTRDTSDDPRSASVLPTAPSAYDRNADLENLALFGVGPLAKKQPSNILKWGAIGLGAIVLIGIVAMAAKRGRK